MMAKKKLSLCLAYALLVGVLAAVVGNVAANAMTEEATCTADGVCTTTEATTTTTTTTTENIKNDNKTHETCVNANERCDYWASIGECKKNPKYMHSGCRKSCKICTPTTGEENTEEGGCIDEDERCADWASVGECDRNLQYMRSACRKSCQTCNEDDAFSTFPQGVDMGTLQYFKKGGKIKPKDFRNKIQSSREYLQSKPIQDEAILALCKNSNEECTNWALTGECDKNPSYMKRKCAAACESCEFLSIEGRCPLDPNATDAWGPGDLDKMFETITSEPYLSRYDVKTFSSPQLNDGPWLITLDNVVTPEEAERLVRLGKREGYKQSKDVGAKKADGSYDSRINPGRTSTNAWCQKSCYKDELALGVIYRLSNITGIEERNSEYIQLLRYEEGQHYNVHHDYIPHYTERQPGVRILTFYLYLNDVEAGGGTNFDKLNITVTPKLGRAVLWPSVLNEDPNAEDKRTTHQALPVERGIKYGANAWFHMRDFKTPHANSCV